jgi:hypothetical protein
METTLRKSAEQKQLEENSRIVLCAKCGGMFFAPDGATDLVAEPSENCTHGTLVPWTLSSSQITKLMITVEVARRAAIRRNEPHIPRCICRDAEVIRVVNEITMARAGDLLFVRLFGGDGPIAGTGEQCAAEAGREVAEALIQAIETTCEIKRREAAHDNTAMGAREHAASP